MEEVKKNETCKNCKHFKPDKGQFYVINCDCQAKLKDAGWDCIDDVINSEKYYKEKCKRLETERLQKELIKSVANATYGIPSIELITKLEDNGKCQNELKEIKIKLKDAGWDCVDDVINAKKKNMKRNIKN